MCIRDRPYTERTGLSPCVCGAGTGVTRWGFPYSCLLYTSEMGIYYGDHRYKVIHNRQRAVLNEMPNVLLLPHTAFFTDQAVSDMVEYSIVSCLNTVEGRENPWEIKK